MKRIDIATNQRVQILADADQPISFPVGAHVTLAGFAAGTSLSAVQALVESWFRRVSALRITVEGLSCLPRQQIVFARVLKTPELLDALSQLRQGRRGRSRPGRCPWRHGSGFRGVLFQGVT